MFRVRNRVRVRIRRIGFRRNGAEPREVVQVIAPAVPWQLTCSVVAGLISLRQTAAENERLATALLVQFAEQLRVSL